MTTTTATIAAPVTTRTPGWAGAFAGLIGAAVALGVSELIAGVLSPGSSLIAAVGQTIIDLQPPGAKDFVVALFGTNDKLALEILVTGTALAIGALLGYLGRDRFAIAAGGFVAFGIVGFLAVLRLPLASRHHRRAECRDRGHRRDPGHELADADRAPNGDRGPTGRHARLEPSEPAPHGFGDRGRRAGRWGRGPDVRGPLERRAAGGQRPDPARLRGRRRPADRRGPLAGGRRPHPDRHAERPLLPDRHRAPHADRRQRHVAAPDPRHGRSRDDADLGRAAGDAAVRAVRDDRVREQRDRRQSRGQREMDRRSLARGPRPRRRPGRRRSARRPVGRRLDRGHADGLGHGPGPRADDRGAHERRPAAAPARVPGPADRSRPVRLRVGDQVAGRAGAHDPGCVRCLLGAARLGQGSAHPHAVADRHAARRFGGRRPASRSRAWPGRRTAASRRSRSASTGSGRRPACRHRSRTRRGSSGSTTGTARRAATTSRCVPPTARARSRPTSARRLRRTARGAGTRWT